MRQVFCFDLINTVSGATTSARYASVTNSPDFPLGSEQRQDWLVSGTFLNLFVSYENPPGLGSTRTIRLRVNGADTALASIVTGTQTFNANTVNTASVVAGDRISLSSICSGTTAAASGRVRISIEFESEDEYTSGYGCAPTFQGVVSPSVAQYNGLFFLDRWTTTVVPEIIAIAGTITGYKVTTHIAPGTGGDAATDSFTFVIFKNGVIQDGSAGSQNTTITISGSGTTGSLTFAIPIVPGDTVYVRSTPSGTPSPSLLAGVACVFVATNPTEFHIGGMRTNTGIGNGTRYFSIMSYANVSLTESSGTTYAGVSGLRLAGLWIYLTAQPGAGTWTFTGRKNYGTPAGTFTFSMTGAVNVGSGGGLVECVLGDAVCIQSINSSVSSDGPWSWAIAPAAVEPEEPPEPGVCEDGGEILGGDTPTDGETFEGRVLHPRPWVNIQFDDQTRGYGLTAMKHSPLYYNGLKNGNLISIGAITRMSSDRFSPYKMADCSIEVDDTTREFAILEAATGSKYWFNREGSVRLASQATIEALGLPHTLFHGIWTGYNTSGFRHVLTFTDRLGSEFSDLNLEQVIPERVITPDDFPNAKPELYFRQVVPIAYGRLSDKDEEDVEILLPVTNLTATPFGVHSASVTRTYAVTAQNYEYGDPPWTAPGWTPADHRGESSAVYVTVSGCPTDQEIIEGAGSCGVEVRWDIHSQTNAFRVYGRTPDLVRFLDFGDGVGMWGEPTPVYYDGRRPYGVGDYDILKMDGIPPDENPTTNLDRGRGRIKPIYVGPRQLLDGNFYEEFLFAGHAMTHVEGRYIGGIRIADDDPDVIDPTNLPLQWAILTGLADPWVTYNGNRYYVWYMRQGNKATNAIAESGDGVLTGNFCAIEDVGDASGRTITIGPRVLYHLLQQWVIQSYRDGDWTIPPLSSDGIPWLNADSFAAAEEIEISRLGAAYEVEIYIDQPTTVREILSEAFNNLGLYFSQSNHGQFITTHLNDFFPVANCIPITDVQEITDEPLQMERALREMQNLIDYNFDFRPADGTFEQANYTADPQAIIDNRNRIARGQRREMKWISDPVTARDICDRDLKIGAYPPRYCVVTCTLHATRIKMWDFIKITDVQGIGATGWTDYPLWVMGIQNIIGELGDVIQTKLFCVDVQRFLSAVGFTSRTIAIVGTSTVHFVGTSALPPAAPLLISAGATVVHFVGQALAEQGVATLQGSATTHFVGSTTGDLIIGPDLEVWVELRTFPSAWDNWNGAEIYARLANDDSYYVGVGIRPSTTTPGQARITLWDEVSYMPGESAAPVYTNFTLNEGDAFGFRIVGTTMIAVARNAGVWVELESGTIDTSSAATVAGRIGFANYGPLTGDPFTPAVWEQIQVTEL